MRRLLATLLALSALVVAGCGGGDSDNPLDEALSYLPEDAVFAIALDTDVEGDQYQALDDLIGKFAFGDEIREQLRDQLQQVTQGRFEEDVRPLLGNPAVLGARDAGPEARPIAALKAKDSDSLDELIERTNPRRLGEAAGATLYQDADTVFAIEDDMIVFAADRRELTAALERADGDDHLDEEAFDSGLEGLPDEALARIYVDVEAALKRDPATADARKVKWVNSLRKLGATVTATRNGLETNFRIRTEGDLSDEDLPIAPGEEAPGVISRDGEVGLGLRDLAHIVGFAESAGQAIDPAGFGDYAQAKETINSQLGVDLDEDLVGQLTGNTSATVAIDGDFGVRAELKDPAAMEATLEDLSDVLPSFAEGAGFGEVELGRVGGRNTIWTLTSREGGGQVAFGVVGDALVVANEPSQVRALGAEEPAAVEGARGAAVLNADAQQLANALIAQYGEAFGIPDLGGLGAGLITGPLGDLAGHMSASPDELRGKFTLAIE